MHRSGTSAADTPLLRVSRPVSACSRCKCWRHEWELSTIL